MPFALNIEGNTSIEADAFKAVGGFSEALSGRPGHQGPFLHFKLHRTGYLPSDIIYHPEPVIYHDYEDGVLKYLKKTWTFNRTGELIRSMYPGFAQFSDRTPATTESDFTPQPENIPRKVMTFLLRFTVHVIVSVQDWFTSVDTESLPKRYFLRDGTSIELDDVYDDIWKEDGQLRALKDDQMYRLRITEDGIEEIHLGTVDREILPDHLKESGVS